MFKIAEIPDIELEIAVQGNFEPIKTYSKGVYCFDDAGVEVQGAKVYGSEIDLLPRLLLGRYNVYQRNGQMTHLTTNLTIEQLSKRYGARIESRLYEMFNEVKLVGKDKRRTNA
jgi:DNA replication protein DnaC